MFQMYLSTGGEERSNSTSTISCLSLGAIHPSSAKAPPLYKAMAADTTTKHKWNRSRSSARKMVRQMFMFSMVLDSRDIREPISVRHVASARWQR
ncbi:hypothetical protein WI71_21490 [Burkholderia diffusa]|nr:hypothetical protein WI71_21490 [Burkholderia diffusa]